MDLVNNAESSEKAPEELETAEVDDHSRQGRMNSIRTLPISLTPIAGEALDSWLEGIAHRTHTAFGDVLSAVGLNSYRGNGTSSWIVKLSDDEAERVNAATGVAVVTYSKR
jgi:hypothetical protein